MRLATEARCPTICSPALRHAPVCRHCCPSHLQLDSRCPLLLGGIPRLERGVLLGQTLLGEQDKLGLVLLKSGRVSGQALLTSVGTPGINGNVHGLGIRGRETNSLDFLEGEAASEPSLAGVTSTSSPGRAMSTKSSEKTASLVQGTRPGGTNPGRSCRFTRW